MDDFFFKEIYKTENDFYRLTLNYFIELGESVSLAPDFFYDQINRILLKTNGFIDVYIGSTRPNFVNFLNVLSLNKIGKIEIGSRKDVNSTPIATLDCSIFLKNGIVRVTTDWCAHKESRANELVDTLLKPLIKHDLTEKTYIKNPNGKANKISKDITTASKQLFTLSGYPDMLNESITQDELIES